MKHRLTAAENLIPGETLIGLHGEADESVVERISMNENRFYTDIYVSTTTGGARVLTVPSSALIQTITF